MPSCASSSTDKDLRISSLARGLPTTLLALVATKVATESAAFEAESVMSRVKY